MSGRQYKILYEQSVRYGIPVGQAIISLPRVAHALHDFLAIHGRKLLALEPDPMLVGDESTPALERYRDEKAKMARLDRLEREGKLLRRDDVHESFGLISTILRRVGISLLEQFGAGAAKIIDDALENSQREIDRRFGTPAFSAGSTESIERDGSVDTDREPAGDLERDAVAAVAGAAAAAPGDVGVGGKRARAAKRTARRRKV
jgi:hypothetical protein